MGTGLDSTKSAARPSHEAIEHEEATNESHLDKEAMESARRAEIRIKENEGKNPGNQIFTK